MSTQWSVLLGVVAGLAASGAAVGASVSATSARTSTDPAGEVAGGAKGRKGHPPRYRYIFNSEPAQAVVAAHGWNLLDVSSQSSAYQLPRRTRGIMYAGDYDNSTCDWGVSDLALTARIAAMAGDPKVAGYYFSDEPDPYACPSAPGQHRLGLGRAELAQPAPSVAGAHALQQRLRGEVPAPSALSRRIWAPPGRASSRSPRSWKGAAPGAHRAGGAADLSHTRGVLPPVRHRGGGGDGRCPTVLTRTAPGPCPLSRSAVARYDDMT